MSIIITKPSPIQLDQLYRLDLNTFEICWEYDEWMALQHFEYVRAAVAYGRAVGVLVGAKESDGVDDTGSARILKIMVLPEFRRRGVATRLLDHFSDWCEQGKFTEINMIVPETICVDACAAFLKANEMKAYKVARQAFSILGHRQDAFHFRKKL